MNKIRNEKNNSASNKRLAKISGVVGVVVITSVLIGTNAQKTDSTISFLTTLMPMTSIEEFDKSNLGCGDVIKTINNKTGLVFEVVTGKDGNNTFIYIENDGAIGTATTETITDVSDTSIPTLNPLQPNCIAISQENETISLITGNSTINDETGTVAINNVYALGEMLQDAIKDKKIDSNQDSYIKNINVDEISLIMSGEWPVTPAIVALPTFLQEDLNKPKSINYPKDIRGLHKIKQMPQSRSSNGKI